MAIDRDEDAYCHRLGWSRMNVGGGASVNLHSSGASVGRYWLAVACQGPHLKRSPSIRIKTSTARRNPPIHCHPHPLRWTPSSPWLLLSLDGQGVPFIVLLSSLSLSACTTLVQQHRPPFEARLAG